MKKSLFFYAAAALALTACTSEDDILQTGQTKQAAPQEVGFDVYTPAATNATRAGLVGTMTTGRLQRSEVDGGGFGVYAFLTEDAIATAGDGANATSYTPTAGQDPNFMWNEKILWNSQNLGWYYNPLKYWPNETDNDSQSTPAYMEQKTSPQHLDRLTFFAYAPYVSTGSGATGITGISDLNGDLDAANDVTDPTIKYVSTDAVADVNPNNYVDLLWGVAPAGGLSYTAVNGTTVTVKEGEPLINMIKPDVNTSMKFLFNHALARFGINVVAAIDQVSPGGKLDPNTKITIEKFTITGPFGIGGNLNLNNGINKNIANWTKMTGGASAEGIDGSTATLSADKSITVSTAIADNLKFKGVHTWGSYSVQDVIGVTTAKQDLLDPSTKWFTKLAAAPVYNPGKKYYTDEGTTEAHATLAAGSKAQIDGKWGFFYTESAGVYTKQAADDVTPDYPALLSTKFYFVKATAHTVTAADTRPTTIDAGVKVYTIDDAANDGSTDTKVPTFTNQATYSGGDWTGAVVSDKVYTLEAVYIPYTDLPYAYSGSNFYEAERNYLYVVPTNNVSKNAAAASNEKALRTITVQIEYYITTEDSKVYGGRTQTKNVITKTVELPSLANSKSYMLNVVLGLTSVKIDAEVDDWKVENVQADLPQNTAE